MEQPLLTKKKTKKFKVFHTEEGAGDQGNNPQAMMNSMPVMPMGMMPGGGGSPLIAGGSPMIHGITGPTAISGCP